MSGIVFSKEIFTSFAGTFLALLSAGLVWFLKSAYEKHRREVLALARFERLFALNLTIHKDNFEFIDKWIAALKQDRPYSFHFENYYLDEEETYKLSNLKLINLILSINYKLRRTGLDLNNVYKGYWDVIFRIDSIQDETRKENNLKTYHATVISTLESIKQNYEPLKNEMMDVVAFIRAANNVRVHSLFGYLSKLFVDVFPRITKKSIDKEMAALKANIEEKSRMAK